jgi:hypothetical protein
MTEFCCSVVRRRDNAAVQKHQQRLKCSRVHGELAWTRDFNAHRNGSDICRVHAGIFAPGADMTQRACCILYEITRTTNSPLFGKIEMSY